MSIFCRLLICIYYTLLENILAGLLVVKTRRGKKNKSKRLKLLLLFYINDKIVPIVLGGL